MLPVVLTPEAVYATKPNIKAPVGSSAATMAAAAQADINAHLAGVLGDANVTVAIAAGAIEVANA